MATLSAFLLGFSAAALPLSAAEATTTVGLLHASSQSPELVQVDPTFPSPRWRLDDERWIWRLPWKQWWTGVLLGVLIASVSLTVALRVPGTQRRGRDGAGLRPAPLGPGLYRRFGTLLTDPLVWTFLFSAAALAGLVYSGFFEWLRTRSEEDLPALVGWGPAGAGSGVVGVLVLWASSRWKTNAGDVARVQEWLDRSSLWFLDIIRDGLDEPRRREVARLVDGNELGLIQRTAWEAATAAVDSGRLTPEEWGRWLEELVELEPGPDERSRITARRLALEIANRLIRVNRLGARLSAAERRRGRERRANTIAPPGIERRRGRERRVGSAWRPPGVSREQVVR